MFSKAKIFLIIFIICSVNLFTACATNKKAVDSEDPYESLNRKIFTFNDTLDRALLKPTAQVYRKGFPNPIRLMISNFFSNFGETSVIANDILQGKIKQARNDSTRFVINSTAGFGGLMDVAGAMHLEHHTQDFGLTLAHWGDKNSPYLVIPFLGPSTLRDTYGMVPDYFIFSLYPFIKSDTFRMGLLASYYVQLRAQLLDAENLMNSASLDPYIFQRDAYLQHRAYLIGQNQR